MIVLRKLISSQAQPDRGKPYQRQAIVWVAGLLCHVDALPGEMQISGSNVSLHGNAPATRVQLGQWPGRGFVPVSASEQSWTAPSMKFYWRLREAPVKRFGGKGAKGCPMRSIAQRSIMIDGHKTSVSVEDAFWTELKQIAHLRRVTVASLVGAIDAARKQSNLSSAIRIFVLEHLQNKDKPGVPLESSPVTAGSNE